MDNSAADAVRVALRSLLISDATLTGAPLLNGQHVYLRMSSESVEQIPSIQYYLLDIGLEEGYETMLVRWEIWANSMTQALAIEKRLRLLVHRERQWSLAGATVFTRFEGSTDAPVDTVGITRRVVETTVEIVRQRAA